MAGIRHHKDLTGVDLHVTKLHAATHLVGGTDSLGLGTASIADVPATGDASAIQVVLGNDSRLSDARTPSIHVHGEGDVTDLVTDLAAKIPKSLLTQQGDIIYASAVGTPAVLPHGIVGQVVQSGGHGANPSWLTLGTMAAAAATDYVPKSLFDAYSVLYADTDNTPARLTVGASTVVGRAATGGIVALTKTNLLTLLNVADGANAYVHPTTNGNIHLPASGASTQLLQYSSAGTAKWITLSSDLTIADGGAITIAAKAITLAKMNDMATASLIYRKTALAGAPEVQTLATLKTDLLLTGTNSGDQNAAGVSIADAGGIITATQVEAALQELKTAINLNTAKVTNATHTGDVTGATALTIAAQAVTYAKMQNVSNTDVILGRFSAGAGTVQEIGCTSAGRDLIDDVDAAAMLLTLGAAPASTAVVGTASAADNAIVRFDATTGKLVQNSAITIDDVGLMAIPHQVGITTPVGAKFGISYASYIQHGADTGHSLYFMHNAYLTSPDNVETYNWSQSHASFGSRGIRMGRLDGIVFYADSVATTADTAFTPTERMRIGNNGNVGIGFAAPLSELSINGGLHVGGASDAGDNNLLVDGAGVITGGFGCNAKTAQTAYASGGAITPGAGAYGASSAVNFAAMVTLVQNMRAALVANGIMS